MSEYKNYRGDHPPTRDDVKREELQKALPANKGAQVPWSGHEVDSTKLRQMLDHNHPRTNVACSCGTVLYGWDDVQEHGRKQQSVQFHEAGAPVDMAPRMDARPAPDAGFSQEMDEDELVDTLLQMLKAARMQGARFMGFAGNGFVLLADPKRVPPDAIGVAKALLEEVIQPVF
jgi:hypothetical protein